MRKYDNTCTRRRSWVAAAFITMIVALIGGIDAQSAPQCSVFRYDTQCTGRTKAHATYNPTLEWSIATSGALNPVIGQDGTLYFGTADKCFYAYSGDGSVKWMYRTSTSIGGSAALGLDGSIYIGTTGQLMALTEDGLQKWANPFRFTAQANPTSILIDNSGTLYLGASDSCIYAVNSDGTRKWSYMTGGSVKYGLSASPDGLTIYATSSDGRVYAINANNGSLRWKTGVISGTYNCAVADDGTIYVGSTTGKLYAFTSDGTQKWAFQSQSKVTCAPAIAEDGTIYFGSQDMNLYALNPNGQEKWFYRTGGPIYSSPTIDGNGVMVFGTWPGVLTALNTIDGTISWTRTLTSSVYNSPLVDNYGSIYTLTNDGILTKFSGPTLPEPSSILSLVGLLGLTGSIALRKIRQKCNL